MKSELAKLASRIENEEERKVSLFLEERKRLDSIKIFGFYRIWLSLLYSTSLKKWMVSTCSSLVSWMKSQRSRSCKWLIRLFYFAFMLILLLKGLGKNSNTFLWTNCSLCYHSWSQWYFWLTKACCSQVERWFGYYHGLCWSQVCYWSSWWHDFLGFECSSNWGKFSKGKKKWEICLFIVCFVIVPQQEEWCQCSLYSHELLQHRWRYQAYCSKVCFSQCWYHHFQPKSSPSYQQGIYVACCSFSWFSYRTMVRLIRRVFILF